MMNDRAEQQAVRAAILDDLLSRWHHKCDMFRLHRQNPVDPSFQSVVSNRHWETLTDIADDDALKLAMKAMDFHIFGDKNCQGGIEDPHKAALLILARNLYTGRSVWLSPRLPKDPVERGTIVAEARNQLTARLMSCGVM